MKAKGSSDKWMKGNIVFQIEKHWDIILCGKPSNKLSMSIPCYQQ